MIRFFLVSLFVAVLLLGCKRIETNAAGVSDPKDAPQYTVKAGNRPGHAD